MRSAASSSQSPLYSGGFLAAGEKAAVASLPCSSSPQKAVAAPPLLGCKRPRDAPPCFGPFAAAALIFGPLESGWRALAPQTPEMQVSEAISPRSPCIRINQEVARGALCFAGRALG